MLHCCGMPARAAVLKRRGGIAASVKGREQHEWKGYHPRSRDPETRRVRDSQGHGTQLTSDCGEDSAHTFLLKLCVARLRALDTYPTPAALPVLGAPPLHRAR